MPAQEKKKGLYSYIYIRCLLSFQAASEYSRHRGAFYVSNLDIFLKAQNATLFMTQPVSNLTFDGVLDAIMEAANDPDFGTIGIPIPFDKFGWFYPVRFIQ